MKADGPALQRQPAIAMKAPEGLGDRAPRRMDFAGEKRGDIVPSYTQSAVVRRDEHEFQGSQNALI